MITKSIKHAVVIYLLLIHFSTATAQEINNRPQTPTPPYPYTSEEVRFSNQQADIVLAGTLTLPQNQTDFPTVILISGSSPHNRNEEIAGHQPFLVIADYLTRNGIGVLRYDDRGVGESEGQYEMAAYADRSSDVENAIAFLKTRKEINPHKIGLIGHSEGGLIAARVAADSKDVSFAVLLAAPGIPGYDMIPLQTQLTNKAKGISDSVTAKELAFLKIIFDEVIATEELAATRTTLTDNLQAHPELWPEGMQKENVAQILEIFTAGWFQRVLQYDPANSLEQVKCPVLAINGSKDLQIPPDKNLDAIANALDRGGNQHVTIQVLPGLNHLFQKAETGLTDEFATIEQTFSPVALDLIAGWISSQE